LLGVHEMVTNPAVGFVPVVYETSFAPFSAKAEPPPPPPPLVPPKPP
jgi:hypothetical protein